MNFLGFSQSVRHVPITAYFTISTEKNWIMIWDNFCCDKILFCLTTDRNYLNISTIMRFFSQLVLCLHAWAYLLFLCQFLMLVQVFNIVRLTLPFHNGTEKIGVYGGSSYIRTLHESYHKPWTYTEWIPSLTTL